MSIEYRIGWGASSNASFRGASDWEPWHKDEDTVADIERELQSGSELSDGLALALAFSGFEWWVETREASS